MPSSIFKLTLAAVFCFLIVLPQPISAQSDIANVYDIADTNAKNGDVMTFVPSQGITRSSVSYDNHLFGVLQDSPIAVFRRVDGTGKAIVRSGVATVNVTTINGEIKAGDYITSSEIPGAASKADISGYTIGIAINDFGAQSGTALSYQGKNLRQGQIEIAVNVQFVELTTPRTLNRLFTGLGAAFIQSSQAPDAFAKAVKYIIAGLVMLLTIIFDFIILSRSIPKAIEALGRNPLGRSTIMLSLGLNLGMVALTIVAALAISFFIFRL